MKFDQEMLERADVVMFWIPRSNDMLGLSTNIEFGYLLNKGNIVYGRPDTAMRCEFLDFLYKEKLGKNYLSTLEDTVKETINVLKIKDCTIEKDDKKYYYQMYLFNFIL